MFKVTFDNSDTAFFQALKTSVDDYFTTSHLKRTGNWKLYAKTITLIPAAIGIYVSLLVFPMHWLPAVLLCGCLGFILACIGFNVMHDANHGSYSSRKWVNNLMGLSLNMLGGNAFIWKFKHNIVHHTYTNVDGIDDDIAKSPLMRHCATQKWVPAHRFQHIYMVFLYAISTIGWTFLQDFQKYFNRKVHNTDLQQMNVAEHIIFWVSKLLYVVFYVLVPALVVGWIPWLIGFLCMHIVLGLVLAIVFQLAHVVEETEFALAIENDPKKIEAAWAVHQVNTTANFATGNKVISWFSGGLNYQIEHHLFPRISHVHYPAISRIVKNTCRQFNLDYHEFPTMGKAIISHFKVMRQLGKQPDTIKFKTVSTLKS
jgi:linoleoyl-CoA desaturase